MNRAVIAILIALAFSIAPSAARIGDPAPEFSNKAISGQTYTLADLKGRWVVLEWHNPDCEFSQKHYNSGNLPRLQKQWTSKGVVWLTVVSPNVPVDHADVLVKATGGAPTAVLLDTAARTASAYAAKTSPQMFVIDPKGMLVYNGAIDDKPTADPADVATAKNYVVAALTEAMSGRPITTATSRPYGCAVKYPGSTP
jgi:peroxiredoxin